MKTNCKPRRVGTLESWFPLVLVAILATGAVRWGGMDRAVGLTTLERGGSPDSTLDARADPLVPPILLDQFLSSSVSQAYGDLPGLGDEFAHGEAASFHAHGQQVCASGCAASRHPTEKLTRARFDELMFATSRNPLDGDNRAFETLLYYGRQTRQFISQHGYVHLDTEQSKRLRRELLKTHAIVSIRVVDEAEEVRSWIHDVRVPLDRRHVFDMETKQLQPLVTSGTVKRVGLDHLWTRL